MFCSACGKKNNDDAKFCFSCGSALAGPESPNLQPERPSPPSAEAPPPAKAQQQADARRMRNQVLGTSSSAWMLAVLGWFFFPPVFWGMGTILGYIAVSKASSNLDVFSKRDVTVCGIGAIANLLFLGWWGIQLVDLLP